MSKEKEQNTMNEIIKKSENILNQNEKELLARTLDNLNVYYPEHKTYAIDAICSNIRENCAKLSKLLKYVNINDFLEAYGYEMISGEAVYELRKECGFNKSGKEPDIIKERVENTIQILNNFYPNRVIEGTLHNDHKSLANTISGLYMWLGYQSANDFLKEYGFNCEKKAEIPSVEDPVALLSLLKKLYPKGTSKSLEELQNENFGIPWELLKSKSSEYLGMGISEYLTKEGVLIVKSETGLTQLNDESKEKEFANSKNQYDEKANPYEEKELNTKLHDVPVQSINIISNNISKETETVSKATKGILSTGKTPKEKIEEIISVLKERYIDTNKKAETISDLIKQNRDLEISSLKNLIWREYGKTQTEYLTELGILPESKWEFAARLEKERIAAQKVAHYEKFNNDLPFNEAYKIYNDAYMKQTIENPYYDLQIPNETIDEKASDNYDSITKTTTETTSDGFVITREISEEKLYVMLDEYQGQEEIVTVPEDVTSIRHRCFSNINLKKVIVSMATVNISRYSFTENIANNLMDEKGFFIVGTFLLRYSGTDKEVYIPEGVEVISEYAFKYSEFITTVFMPDSLRVIGNSAFNSCDHLTTVVFSEKTKSLEEIGDYAFKDCVSLKSINLPHDVKSKGYEVFSGCGISAENKDFDIVGSILLKYNGYAKTVEIPHGVTLIWDEAFSWKQFVKVKIPEGVISIGNNAFFNNRQLEEVIMPTSLHTIEKDAFGLCDKLSIIDLSCVLNIDSCAFQLCNFLENITFSTKLKKIGNEAFHSCSIKTIMIPGTVKKIGDEAFRYCKNLSTVLLSEGIEEIGKLSFADTTSLVSINIPSSVVRIGRNAFYSCRCGKDIVLPETFNTNKELYGIADENNCIIRNNILDVYVPSNDQTVVITKGVVVLDEESLRYALPKYVQLSIKRIVLPDSVREIRHESYPVSDNLSMNIPCGYLLQKRKLPIKPLKILLSDVWKYEASMLDWVSVYVNQKSKQLNDYCMEAFSIAPNAFVVASLVILNDQYKPKEVDRLSDIVFDLRKEISQEYVDKFYLFAKEVKAKNAISVLTPYVSTDLGGTINATKIYANALEEFCDKNFEKYDFERIMKKAELIEKNFEDSGVKYAVRDEAVSAFVLKCAIVPYIGQLREKPRNYGSYLSEFSEFEVLEKCDSIAQNFEKKSFLAFIDTLATLARGYSNPQTWIPVCRFGSGNQVKNLISSMNAWSSWSRVGSKGRVAIMISTGAIMLSDTREAMMYCEKRNILNYYAEFRGMSADVIRDTKLADFGFNIDGKKIYDVGSTIIEATVGNDLAITLYDTKVSKVVKSIPKKGSDVTKYEACSADYSELKKNVKKVVKTRNDLLFKYFLSNEKLDATSWITSYTENPVLNKVARLLVWAQGKQTFTLGDSGAIDSLGNTFVINKSSKIFLAHPIEMEDSDIERWQKYFISNNLKQPFEQIWEPKIKNVIESDRYKGCLIPYFRFKDQEKHGIYVGNYDYYNEIDISFDGCTAEVVRIDLGNRNIDVKDKFEIKSFKINRLYRKTNHIINYLDKCTIFGRIEKDDDSVLQYLAGYTVAQIDSFLKFAIEKSSTKCTAALLNYKHVHFADFEDIDGFTLNF